jgi:hypothetical protein
VLLIGRTRVLGNRPGAQIGGVRGDLRQARGLRGLGLFTQALREQAADPKA